jgi:hypothetical protein
MILSRKKILKLISDNKTKSSDKWEPHIKSIIISHFKYNNRNVPKHIVKLFVETNDGVEFEKLFERKILKNMKFRIDYRVQESLVNQQTKIFGRALATPDFLFTSTKKIYYNSKHVMNGNWIDVKDFFGQSQTFETGKLYQQARRNIALFGPGAFVFSLGIEKELKKELEEKFTIKVGTKKLKLLKLLPFSTLEII